MIFFFFLNEKKKKKAQKKKRKVLNVAVLGFLYWCRNINLLPFRYRLKKKTRKNVMQFACNRSYT